MLPALVLSFLFQVTVTPVVVHETIGYYDVTGSSYGAVRSALDRLGPKDEAGKPFDAFTKWGVSYEWKYLQTATSCTLTAFGSTLDVEILLPRWVQPSAEPELASRWNEYLLALTRHERGHAWFGRRAAEAIELEVRQIGPEPTCDALGDAVRRNADRVIERFRREERDYDHTTRHGAAQGAVFR